MCSLLITYTLNKMKIIRLIIVFLLLCSTFEKVSGTAQYPDILIYKGDTLSIFANPLESYFESIIRPDSIFEEFGINSTGCWRGYIGYWELKNDSLFLLKLRGASEIIDLALIFKDRKTDSKIFADWVNHPIMNPYGKRVHYVHMGYESIYEYEREFYFTNGLLTDIKEFDNSKSRKCIYTENPQLLADYIEANINYSNIKNNPYSKAKVVIQIYSANEDGKIDSVLVVRGFDNERDKEAVRVIKSIPDWGVLFRRGKQIQNRWTMPIVFGRKE